MLRIVQSVFWFFVGKPVVLTLEHRLFSSLALLNGVANMVGSLNYVSALSVPEDFKVLMLFVLHLASGTVLLCMYLFSRIKKQYYVLFWPFILTIYVFLFINILYNAGTQGGAHYYLITAALIVVILSPGRLTMAACVLLGIAVTGMLFWIEYEHPEWIKFFSNRQERFEDISGAFIFIQLLNSGLVLILRMHFNEERGKSERLLLNILPKSIAEELKINERVRPIDYEEATVLFTDFVGFTHFAEKLEPQKLIEKLDDSFRAFDNIINKYNLEKIKTIGDAYMAVGGLPQTNSTHFLDASLAALEMQAYMSALHKLQSEGNAIDWKLRIGIHTGHIIAGVIGEQKFAYDVWGDAVNIASRMESSSMPGKINVSADVYKRINKFFECSYRGEVEAKNKGLVKMYFVERLQPVYARDLDGQSPNEIFWKEYHKIAKPLLSRSEE